MGVWKCHTRSRRPWTPCLSSPYPHFKVSFSILTSQRDPSEPGAGREGLPHQLYAPHPADSLAAQSETIGRDYMFVSTRAFSASIFHPDGGGKRSKKKLLDSFSHLGSSASQMAAMLMNPTGCYDTAASGRSK